MASSQKEKQHCNLSGSQSIELAILNKIQRKGTHQNRFNRVLKKSSIMNTNVGSVKIPFASFDEQYQNAHPQMIPPRFKTNRNSPSGQKIYYTSKQCFRNQKGNRSLSLEEEDNCKEFNANSFYKSHDTISSHLNRTIHNNSKNSTYSQTTSTSIDKKKKDHSQTCLTDIDEYMNNSIMTLHIVNNKAIKRNRAEVQSLQNRILDEEAHIDPKGRHFDQSKENNNSFTDIGARKASIQDRFISRQINSSVDYYQGHNIKGGHNSIINFSKSQHKSSKNRSFKGGLLITKNSGSNLLNRATNKVSIDYKEIYGDPKKIMHGTLDQENNYQVSFQNEKKSFLKINSVILKPNEQKYINKIRERIQQKIVDCAEIDTTPTDQNQFCNIENQVKVEIPIKQSKQYNVMTSLSPSSSYQYEEGPRKESNNLQLTQNNTVCQQNRYADLDQSRRLSLLQQSNIYLDTSSSNQIKRNLLGGIKQSIQKRVLSHNYSQFSQNQSIQDVTPSTISEIKQGILSQNSSSLSVKHSTRINPTATQTKKSKLFSLNLSSITNQVSKWKDDPLKSDTGICSRDKSSHSIIDQNNQQLSHIKQITSLPKKNQDARLIDNNSIIQKLSECFHRFKAQQESLQMYTKPKESNLISQEEVRASYDEQIELNIKANNIHDGLGKFINKQSIHHYNLEKTGLNIIHRLFRKKYFHLFLTSLIKIQNNTRHSNDF